MEGKNNYSYTIYVSTPCRFSSGTPITKHLFYNRDAQAWEEEECDHAPHIEKQTDENE